MANWARSLSEGLQTGIQLGSALRGANMRSDLARANANYDVTEGAYGPGLQENIQQLQVLREQDPAQAAAYDQAIGELTRRQGLTAPDYSVASGPTNFATRQEARQAAAPMRAEGLAGVYRQYGDVAQADALEARAFDQQRAIAREGRDVKSFETAQRAAEQQGILTGGQISAMKKTQERDTKVEAVDADVADFMSKRLTGPDGAPRQPSMDDNIAALQYRATALQKAGLPKEATDSLKDYQSFAVNQITLDDKLRTSQLGAVAAALATGDLEPARAFYDRFVLDGAKVTGMKADPKTGAITVSRVRDDGTELPDRVIKGGSNELLASLNSFRDPMALYNFSQNEFKNNLQLEELGIKKKSLAIQAASAAESKLSPIEKNVAGLKRLGVNVTPAMVESLAGLDKADSPRLKAQLDVITSAVKEGTLKPEEGLKRVDTVFTEFNKSKQAARDQTEIVSGIKDEAKKGNLPQLVTYLKTERGYTDAALAPLFAEAGVKMPASTATAAEAAQSNVGLVTTRPQPAAYVPPAGSPAARAQEARAQATATQAESVRLATQAQQKLASEFAADVKTLSPEELSNKYDSKRSQLPRNEAARLQSIERTIR